MPALLKKVSTITEKGQITVPKSVREALGVGYGGRVAFYVAESGEVSIRKEVDESGDDPVIDGFLSLLAKDLADHPNRIQAFPPQLAACIAELVNDVSVDLDEPLLGDVAL
ncbi:type II toxin-antitoxin system PrlF family antitoxin [Rhizobium oryzicola]|uniref:Type II toxin-antitoxin system PrlF family antitoxin n=1 Tax=Rhizobium oryzicola TaxID=1232668 RepID=A0ABT8SSN7_9HYPH|nr:type II toxin-antitoxin system PrlF family antitoxin [Rhizobium oryzicola]MDO1581255.1 type II toxin-antitoxin system PrlF family antitoxin [Rhizobium oryzicola]